MLMLHGFRDISFLVLFLSFVLPSSIFAQAITPSAVKQGKVDANYANVVLLMHMESTTDEKGHAITNNGAVTFGAPSIFGTKSASFNGAGQYLSTPDSADWNFPGAFTVEFWANVTAWNNNAILIQVNIANGLQVGRIMGANSWGVARSGIVWVLGTGSLPSTGAWHHFAVTRDGANNLRLFTDGTLQNTVADATNYANGVLTIAADNGGGSGSNAFIDELRITKGVARYTGNFTVPKRGFPNR